MPFPAWTSGAMAAVLAACGTLSCGGADPRFPLPDLGPGFVDASGALGELPTFVEVDPTVLVSPGVTHGVFGDLDEDGFPEVIVSSVIPDASKVRAFAFRYDRDARRLVPDPRVELA